MSSMKSTWFRLAGAAALAIGLSACAADGPSAVAPVATQTSLGANPAMGGGMAGMSHGNMAGMNHAGMAGMNHGSMGGMDHSRMTPAQMRTMMAQCDGVRADARRGATLSAERQATLQHCDMMQPAATPAGGSTAAPAAAHRH